MSLYRRIFESDEGLRRAELEHSKSPTAESTMRLAQSHLRAGDHNRAFDVLHQHDDMLDRNGRNMLSRLSARVFSDIHGNYMAGEDITPEHVSRAADSFHNILPHDMSGEPLSRGTKKSGSQSYYIVTDADAGPRRHEFRGTHHWRHGAPSRTSNLHVRGDGSSRTVDTGFDHNQQLTHKHHEVYSPLGASAHSYKDTYKDGKFVRRQHRKDT